MADSLMTIIRRSNGNCFYLRNMDVYINFLVGQCFLYQIPSVDSEQFNRKQTWFTRMSGGHNHTSKQAKWNEYEITGAGYSSWPHKWSVLNNNLIGTCDDVNRPSLSLDENKGVLVGQGGATHLTHPYRYDNPLQRFLLITQSKIHKTKKREKWTHASERSNQQRTKTIPFF